MKTFLNDIIKKYYGEDYVGHVFSYHSPNRYIAEEGGYEEFYMAAEGEEINDKTIFIGCELEMGLTKDKSSSEVKEMLTKVVETIPCILEHDSSIASNSHKYVTCDGDVEIITQPMTIKKWLELAPKIKTLFKELADFGYESHNLGSCGIHFHYTIVNPEKKADIVNRYWLQLHTWESEVHKIAGRGYVHYAQDLDFDDMVVPEEKLALSSINEKVVKQGPNKHESVVNLQHSNSIEIRICKGTLNFDTFMARLEFFYNMYVQACDLKTIAQRMTWGKLINTPHIKAYVERHDIATYKKAYDYSTKLQVLFKSLDDYDAKLVTLIVQAVAECKRAAKCDDNTLVSAMGNISRYLASALGTINQRFINDKSLLSNIKDYYDHYGFSSSQRAKINNIIKPIIEHIENKPKMQQRTTETEV